MEMQNPPWQMARVIEAFSTLLVGITPQNLSVLKSGRAKALRFSTLEAICLHLACEPENILIYQTGS